MAQKTNNTPKVDAYEAITARFIAMLERAERDGKSWKYSRNWKVGTKRKVHGSTNLDHNPISGTRYSGINMLSTFMARIEYGYASNAWASFNQIKKAGGKLENAKGKGVPIYKYITRNWTEKDENGNEEEKGYRTLKLAGFVFNFDLVSGIEASDVVEVETDHDGHVLNVDPQAMIDLTSVGVDVHFRGDQAAYSPGLDAVVIPRPNAFKGDANFVSTLVHEIGHATGHKSRLNRDLSGAFGSAKYAKEELIAELTSVFVTTEYGINGSLENHAAYLASWLAALKNDKRLLASAAARANEAAKFILRAKHTREAA